MSGVRNESGSTSPLMRALPTGIYLGGLVLIFVAERLLGDMSTWRWVLLGIGLCAGAAAIAMRGLALRKAQGDSRKVMMATIVAYVGGLGALGLYWLGDTATEGSTLRLLLALWPAVMACAVSPLIAMEVSFASMPLGAGVELRRVVQSARTGLVLALGVTFAFALNYAADGLEVRKDLSYFKTSMPSESTFLLVEQIGEGAMEVVLFFPDANEVYEQAAPYFEALAARVPAVTVRRTDHALDPLLATEHKVPENGYVVLLHEERAEKWKLGTKLEAARRSLRKLDGDFQERYRKLAKSANIAYLTAGHRELDARRGDDRVPGEKVQVIRELLRRLNVTVKPLGLAQGLASEVPEDASVVVVLGPVEDFLPEEKDALVRYVDRGGRLLLMVDPDAEADLSPVLARLGVVMHRETLVSEFFVRATGTPADRTALATRSFSSHPSVTTVSRNAAVGWGVAFNRVGYLAKAPAPVPAPAPKVTFTVRSMPATWNDLNGNFELDGDTEKKKVYQLAAAVTIPAGEGGVEARAVIVADSHLVTDRFMLGSKGNQALFVDSLLWLLGEESISAGPPTSEEDIRIVHTRDQDVAWFYGTVFGMPGLVLVGGLWFTRRRRRRRSE